MPRLKRLASSAIALVFAATSPAWAAAAAGASDDAVSFFRWIDTDNAGGVERLLKGGFDPNTRDDHGQVGLFVALRAHSLQAARVLWDASATQIDATNAANETPLMIAAMRGEPEAVQVLVARGAAVNRAGWSPLHYAATGGNVEVIKLLLAHGAALETRSPNASTPLMMAAKYGSDEAVDALLAAGADKRARNDLGLDASGFAASAGREKLAVRLKVSPAGS